MKIQFGTPEELLQDPELQDARKINLLRQWEYDERQIAVAVDEGMPGPGPRLLQRIVEALMVLEERQAIYSPKVQSTRSSQAAPPR